MLSKRIFESVLPTLVVLFASVFSFSGVVYAQPVENPRPLSVNNQIIEQQTQEIQNKSVAVYSTNQTVNTLRDKKESLQKQIDNENRRVAELRQKIAQKKASEARKVRVVQAVAQTAPSPVVSGCGDNSYAAYIYSKESGCRTTARNASGCYGIGQACPGSKVAHCGADYACQNAWFTDYAMRRYGSWANAYNFHKANGWW